MNTSTITTTTMLPTEAAQEIYELAISHREETEQLRRLAPAVVDRIKASGLFRMGLPKFLGGWEDNPVEVLKAYEILSSGEAAVAWSVWNNHLACTFGRFLDEDSMREIYKNHSDVYANSARPEGIAEIVDGGYSVSGRWSLVSGCELSDWFVMRCLVTSEDLPKTLGPGAKLKLFFIPKEDINIIDTWSVGGLRGTGSHDIEIKDAFVQEKYAIDFENTIHVDNAYNRLPIGCLNSAGCASIALGLLKSATDELISLCLERVTPGKSPDLRDRDSVQSTIAKSKTTLASKRTQLHNAVETLWNESLEGNTYTDIQLADVWAASIEAATASRALVSEIYAVTGTASLYTKYKIERVHRDVHAVLQHGMVQPHWLNQAGMAYVGLKPNGAMFRT
ncbi:acyl-CoA dehydrogenase family protein [Winogradskyella forsetii]|uniref:acyl-CoA dehydrogenase family protein n=1 Tax=Winogradskyella forsetii TaxID=2686077 RepID=UPI0015C16E57|nr:acyl-CoA dehydrogenase family protein [Winogradskyella forsetii]